MQVSKDERCLTVLAGPCKTSLLDFDLLKQAPQLSMMPMEPIILAFRFSGGLPGLGRVFTSCVQLFLEVHWVDPTALDIF